MKASQHGPVKEDISVAFVPATIQKGGEDTASKAPDNVEGPPHQTTPAHPHPAVSLQKMVSVRSPGKESQRDEKQRKCPILILSCQLFCPYDGPVCVLADWTAVIISIFFFDNKTIGRNPGMNLFKGGKML